MIDAPRGVAAPAVLLVLAAAAVYANGLSGPFLFDDFAAIVDNPAFREPASPLFAFSAPDESTLAGRPIVTLTFALNHAVFGKEVRGYHATNVLIHALCALALYGVVRRTLAGPRLAATFGGAATRVAFAAALVFTVHPLCSEAVDYVVQRTETLMALFYLLTLYCATRSYERGARQRLWIVASLLACALGMGSKEVMVSCPLVVALHGLVYFGYSNPRWWRKQTTLWAGLAACWAILALSIAAGPRGESVGFGLGVSAWSYAKNQCVVLVDYLAHAVWPQRLVFDYGYPRDLPLGAVALGATLLLLLVGLATYLVFRRPAVGFPAVAFFAILAPTSSVVPIVTEVGAERRVYLPLACLIALAVAGLHLATRSRPGIRVALLLIVVALLGARTVQRNADYRSAESIWRSAVSATPQNPRAHNGLGRVLYNEGRIDEAVASYTRALEIEPDYYHAQFNLGLALTELDRPGEALARFERAASLHPGRAEARYRMSSVLASMGNSERAVEELREALRLDPTLAEGWNDLGNAMVGRGRKEEGIAHLRRALELRPDFALAHYNLAIALDGAGDPEGAIDHARRAVALSPGDAMAHNNLGALLQRSGRLDEAVESYREALRLEPGTAEAANNLGLALRELGRLEPALEPPQ